MSSDWNCPICGAKTFSNVENSMLFRCDRCSVIFCHPDEFERDRIRSAMSLSDSDKEVT